MGDKKKNGYGRLALNIVLIVIISVFIGSMFYSINAKRVMHNEMPMPFGIGAAVVMSGSMEPELSVNDLVIAKAADTYNVGDIVIYQSGTTLVIHRIVQINDDEVITKGDANNAEDLPVQFSDIKGKAVFVIPFIGMIAKPLQTTAGKLVVVIIIAMLLTMSRKKEREKDDESINELVNEIKRLKAEIHDKPDQEV